MLLVLKDHLPNVDSGRNASAISGKFMQKAGNEHYVLLPAAGQSNLTAGIHYLAVVSEGVNPASASRIGTGTSSYDLASLGDVTAINLGVVSLTDNISTNDLEGGESRIYQFTVPTNSLALEVRLENRVGNPMLAITNSSLIPDPGGVLFGQRDAYGNDGGASPLDVNSNIVVIPNPPSGIYTLAIKARAAGANIYPDASYVLRVRLVPVPELNFTEEFNTNGLSNVASDLLVDGQRAYYKVVVPTNVWGQPVIGWELNVSQLSGIAVVRVRKDTLPSDTFAAGMPFTRYSAIIAPPFLTNGTWYVEVRGTNSTEFTLSSHSVKVQRPAWGMPLPGEPTTTPGMTAPEFADTGVDTNGVALPGDQGIDLETGRYHFYAVTVPTNNGGLMRIALEAISGNSDLYLRTGKVPTFSHRTNGSAGTILDRSVTGVITEYANWVPISNITETCLAPGTWYLGVRAVTNANARYRLRLSIGNVQDLNLTNGVATNQIVAGGDWRYYRVQVPEDPQLNWHLTFNQQAGDVVMHVRENVPPGNGTSTQSSQYKDWQSDAQNSGPYANYDLPGTYTLSVPPLRPGSIYYVGFRGKNDSTFSVSSSVSGPVVLPPLIEFYGGSVTSTVPVAGLVAYRIFAPADALRWRHTSTHSNTLQVYIENGTMPSRTTGDDFRSTSANSTQDRFMTNYPWVPDQMYFMVATNTSASPQQFIFTMNGSSTNADDDVDGLNDAWEVQYFGNLNQTPGTDFDIDGVSNLSEYQEGTNPNDKTSFRPRLVVLSTNGVVNLNPSGSNFAMNSTVTLTPVPNAGYSFVGWLGNASGTDNPLNLLMDTNKTVIPRFRVPADDFDQRIPLSGYSLTHSGLQNTGASKETGEPNHAGNSASKSLWWTWNAPFSGNVLLTTAGTDFRNALGVYTGSFVTNLTSIASHLAGAGTNTSQVNFTASAGTIYHFAVDGYAGATGSIVLNLSMPGLLVLSDPLRPGDGTFHFNIVGSAGQVVRIEAGTNLVNWTTLFTITNVTGVTPIVDPDASNYTRRYYRGATP